ncbi:MAG: glutathione-disulfide reductase [Kofleriaceae bacterium]|jgi:glutathione reductase (NADPH)|nr:glutathione-disulfide reductase [Kofleriaceae bacterium]MBP6840652.1 glutathione-disulfide reductase [Kofleriaceae bacterium]MBP9204570.1 glutathione-disulfide reductase [Kofleriaceae bacterium]
MSTYDVDLFVIGGGSGGVRAARIAAGHGARVAIAEESRWGGTCVIRGCVPKKLLVYGSELAHTLRDAAGYGWTIDGARHDWATLTAAVEREVSRLSAIYDGLLGKAGAEHLAGRARLRDAHTVEVAGRQIRAAHVLVATGGQPVRPAPALGLAAPGGDGWIVSDDVFHLPARPARLLVVGGGYIAVEFAHVFAALGTAVTLVHRDTSVLRGFDADLREAAMLGLAQAGVTTRMGRTVAALHVDAGGATRRAVLDDGAVVEVDVALAAIGRAPRSGGLGLTEAGVVLGGRGEVVVDAYGRTSVPHIYAVGDVTGRAQLTPVAIREGHAVADTLFAGRPTVVDHSLIPTAVFTQPPLATVGLSEEAARAAGHEVEVFRSRFRPMRHVLPGREQQVWIKMVVERGSRRMLGLHLAGLDAPEIVQAAAIAITMGARKDDFDRTLAIHPTTAEELVLLRG